MHCIFCGKELDEKAVFCPACGLRQSEDTGDEWYYVKDGIKYGPCSLESMKREIAEERIGREDFVWKEGMKEWIPAKQTCLIKYLNVIAPNIPVEAISNKYAWTLATVPIFVSWIIEAITGLELIAVITAVILNTYFASRDAKTLKKSGKDAEAWGWLGFFLVPIYLLIRSAKIDKKYGYVIAWCIMAFIDICM
ncbi:MAG: GYF domain-containing protein [Eubacteriales bacterium]|nr:GYF domain-containing protein [Eubacteriales bacterium]